MPLNKSKGNMYPFVDFTYNPIKGKCSHDCSYCFMKRWPQAPLRLMEKEFYDLGQNYTIFVGSSTDMFAPDVPYNWIDRVLAHCSKYSSNIYLFQSKNPGRFPPSEYMPKNLILAATIESNREHHVSNAMMPVGRAEILASLAGQGLRLMVSIEPILDFDVGIFKGWVETIKPEFVSIGADSKGHNLPEPPKEKVLELITELEKFTRVIQKDNLRRLLK